MKKNMKSKDNNIISNRLKKFTKKITNKNKTKKYELLNVLSETGDLIYSPQYEEFVTLDGGQKYLAEDKIREIVQDELTKYFNRVNFNKNEY